MSNKNKEMLDEAVKKLKRFGFKMENVILTGSIALYLHGILPDDREAHDVDVIIRMSDEMFGCLRLLEVLMSDDYADYRSDQQVMLHLKNINLNIWKASSIDFEKPMLKENHGMFVAPVGDIIRAKKSYDRVKDYKDIQNICKYLLS